MLVIAYLATYNMAAMAASTLGGLLKPAKILLSAISTALMWPSRLIWHLMWMVSSCSAHNPACAVSWDKVWQKVPDGELKRDSYCIQDADGQHHMSGARSRRACSKVA